MKRFHTFCENLTAAPPAARWLLRLSLLGTNLLLLAALASFCQSLPLSAGTAALYGKALLLVKSGAAFLLLGGLISALLRK